MAKYKVKITETYTREVIVDVDNDVAPLSA